MWNDFFCLAMHLIPNEFIPLNNKLIMYYVCNETIMHCVFNEFVMNNLMTNSLSLIE